MMRVRKRFDLRRYNVHLTEAQIAELKRRAEADGPSVARQIRKAVSTYLGWKTNAGRRLSHREHLELRLGNRNS
jgi:hypothetical protein